jgi:hypothetical protein
VLVFFFVPTFLLHMALFDTVLGVSLKLSSSLMVSVFIITGLITIF